MVNVVQISIITQEVPDYLFNALNIKEKSLHMITTYYEGALSSPEGKEYKIVLQHVPPELLADSKIVAGLMHKTKLVLLPKSTEVKLDLDIPVLPLDGNNSDEVAANLLQALERT